MIGRLSQRLTLLSENSDLTRKQQLLNLVLLALAVPGFLFGVISAISWILGSPQASVGAISGLSVQLFYLLSYWIGRRGNVRLAGYFPVVTLFIIMIGSTYQQGIGHSTMIGFAMTALTASILIGVIPGFVFAVLATFSYLIIGISQANGIIPNPIAPESTVILDSAAIGFGLAVILAFYWVNNRQLIQSYKREIELSNELKNQQEHLEKSVKERTEELDRRVVQLRAAAEVGRAATTIRDLNTLLTKITHLISERFGFYHVGIFLLDTQNEYAILQATNSEGGQRMLDRNHRLKIGEVGIVGYVAAHQVPRIALNVGEDVIYFDNPDLPETRSEMALPLIVGENVLGALDVQSKLPNAFSEENISTLEILADQVAIAIENARLVSNTQDALEITQRAYGDIGLDAWKEIIGQSGAWGYRYDVHSSESVTKVVGKHDLITASSIANSQTILDENRLMLPLQIRGVSIGLLQIEKDDLSSSWTDSEITLLESIAEQLSLALDSARLYQDSQRRATTERVIGEATSRMRESLDLERVLKTAAGEIRQSLGLDKVVIRLATEDNQEGVG